MFQIADVLLQMRPDNMNSHVESNYNRNLDDVINLLPDLGRGLDVNVKYELFLFASVLTNLKGYVFIGVKEKWEMSEFGI